MTDMERALYLQSNVAYVSLYFSSLDYMEIITTSGYTLVDLCSDLGGSFGFWMGLSILTLFEVLELFVDLLLACCSGRKEKNEVAAAQM